MGNKKGKVLYRLCRVSPILIRPGRGYSTASWLIIPWGGEAVEAAVEELAAGGTEAADSLRSQRASDGGTRISRCTAASS